MNTAGNAIHECWKAGAEFIVEPVSIIASPKTIITDKMREGIKAHRPQVREMLLELDRIAWGRLYEYISGPIILYLKNHKARICFNHRECVVLLCEPYGDNTIMKEISENIERSLKNGIKRAFILPLDVKIIWRPDLAPAIKSRNYGFVYLVGSDDGMFCKIGRAKDVSKRLEQIKLQLPYKIKLLHTIRVSDSIWAESYLHRKYRHCRMNGEWFKLSDSDIRDIKSITRLERGDHA
jgi:hypothetical protein